MMVQPSISLLPSGSESALLSTSSFSSDLLKSLFDTAPPLMITYLAHRYHLVITPSLCVFTVSFFAVRILLHTVERLARNPVNDYARRYKVLYHAYEDQLQRVRCRIPRIESIIYLACFVLAYLYMPMSLALSVLCGVSRGLLLPI